MAHLPSLADDAHFYDALALMPQVAIPLFQLHDHLLRGDEPLTVAERELLFAYVSGLNACSFCFRGHVAAARLFGIDEDVMDQLIVDLATAPIPERLQPLFAYARKRTEEPSKIVQSDVDAILDAGWSEETVTIVCAITALTCATNRIVDGLGVEVANRRAHRLTGGLANLVNVLAIEPVDATFGAVVTGVKLTDLDEATFDELHSAWLEHALLIFRDQHLSSEEQIAFARRFSEIELLGGHEIVPLTNVHEDGTLRTEEDDNVKILRGNMGWHVDSTYMPVQAKGAVFSAHVVPSSGGETGWADMRAAYEALDDETRAKVHELKAYHSLHYSQAKVGHFAADNKDYYGYGFHDDEPPLRPLVKVHPATGRPSLQIGRHAYGIPGMEPEESESFLEELVDSACQPPRVYHHSWTPGEAVVWDNRRLMHRSRPWDMSEPRVMMHSRIAGDPASELAASA